MFGIPEEQSQKFSKLAQFWMICRLESLLDVFLHIFVFLTLFALFEEAYLLLVFLV